LSILSHFPQENESTSVKIIQPESYNPLMPSTLFDEASQNQNLICGGGAVIHLSENNLFIIKMGLGPGTNNFFELMSLKLLLLFTGEKGIRSIQLFWDSTNVINWVRNTQLICQNIMLRPILDEIFLYQITFENFSIKNVFRSGTRMYILCQRSGFI